MATPDQVASPFRAAAALPVDRRYGGRIVAMDQLPIHALGNDYVIDGNGTVASLPAMPMGETVFLQITGAPTFTNSAKLLCPGGANYVASAGDFVVARSSGDGVWRIYILTAGGSTLSIASSNPPYGTDAAANLQINATVASNILTVAIKNNSGADPSVSSPVLFPFRSTTAASGAPIWSALTAAKSIATTVGATFGATANTAFRLWVVATYDGANFDIGLINCLSSLGIYPLSSADILPTTTLNGSSTSPNTIYAGTGRATQAVCVLGYLEWASGLTTPGTFASGPTTIQLFGPHIRLPGTSVRSIYVPLTSFATGSTAFASTAAAPTSTQGDQFFAQAITPRSPANWLVVDVQMLVNTSSTAALAQMALFQDAGATGLCQSEFQITVTNAKVPLVMHYEAQALLGTSTTFKVRAGSNSGVAFNVNGDNGGANGGVQSTYLRIMEYQG